VAGDRGSYRGENEASARRPSTACSRLIRPSSKQTIQADAADMHDDNFAMSAKAWATMKTEYPGIKVMTFAGPIGGHKKCHRRDAGRVRPGIRFLRRC